MAGAGKLLWGLYPGPPAVWVPLQVDVDGKVIVDMSAINLGDLGDVSVAAPTDGYVLYWDNAAKLWKCKAPTVYSKFTPKVVSTPLWRNDAITDSSFEALINGNPTSTSVVYDNDVREGSLPDITSYPQWGKVILHNVTRGNSRKITGVNTATNTITTEASTDDWANNDIITIGSQTLVYTWGHTYSYFFDTDISAEVPNTAVAMMLDVLATDLGGAGDIMQNQVAFHPFEAWGAGKVTGPVCSSAYQTAMVHAVVPVVSQKICLAFGPWRPICASGVLVIFRLIGYWE